MLETIFVMLVAPFLVGAAVLFLERFLDRRNNKR